MDADSLLSEARWVRRLARSLVRDDAVAEDLVQETWIAALEGAPAESGRLRPWLARVVRNFARQAHRSRASRAHQERISARPERTPSTSETAERLEAQRLLVEALESLAEPYRTTVTLRYLDGLSAAKIARKQGIPAGTVRWRLKHGIDELRARLDGRCGGERRNWAIALIPLLPRPPLVAIATQAAAGGAAATIEGVMMMNTITKVGIAAALVLTASVGVWVAVDRQPDALAPVAASDPTPTPADLAAAPAIPEHVLASAPAVEQRETADAAPPPKPATEPAAAPASIEARVEARFLDRLDRPVEGVQLALLSFGSLRPAASGADGRAHIEVDLPKTTIQTSIEASHAGLATHFGEIVLERGRTIYLGDVHLDPGGSVVGVVLTPEGAPAGAANVVAASPEMQRGLEEARVIGPANDGSVPRGTTLADGSFRIDGVRAGGARIWAGGKDTRWSFTEPVEVPENGVCRVEIRLEALQPQDEIAGIVLSPEGEPVPEAEVRYTGKSGGSSWSGSFAAGKDGRFRHRVQVQGLHDFQAKDREARWPDASALSVEPGTRDLALQFPPPRWLEVSVRERGGEPLLEFAANVLSADKKRTLRPAKVEAHERGRVSVLLPSEPFVIDVRARGHGNAVLGPWAPAEAPATAECALDDLPGVRGRVLAEGAGVSGAKLSLYELAGDHSKIEINGFLTRLHPTPEDTTTSDEEGWFQLDPTRPGGADGPRFFQHDAKEARSFAILCEANGWALVEVSPLAVDPAIGAEGIQIELVKGGAIEGRVLTAPGKEPAGIVVGVDRYDGKPRTQRVGPDGRFHFDHLAPGAYHVARADKEWNGNGMSTSWSSGDSVHAEYPTNASVADGRTTRFDLDLRDDQPCVLIAQVSVNGAPATGWTAVLRPGDRNTVRRSPGGAVDGQGRLRLEIADPGPADLVLEPPSEAGRGATFELHVEMHRGDNAVPVDLRVGAVRGRCAAAPAQSSLSFDPDSKGPIVCRVDARIDAGGRFEMPCVLAGPARIGRNEVHADGSSFGPVAEAHVDVPMGGSADVTVP
ncbi:MAG TPA: sigma-70 family RNA polymerase sigma factor [Planctomycetota bacterium]|jgi:RNA polymerase sigma-70 factor (ECF subfamily)|nr:sigma-70 family RNA polymerase sigma factor [Planctomycetota bacterium]